MLDTRLSLETPEGTIMTLESAGPVVRILAYSLDVSIRFVIQLVLGITLSFAGKFGIGMLLISVFLLEWFYPVFFEIYNQGMTPGKKRMGLRVIHEDGTPIGWTSSIIRNLFLIVDFLPFAYMGGILSMVLTPHFKRLGDLAAGTLVVYVSIPSKSSSLPEVPSHPSPIPLTLEERRAILHFAERSQQLSQARSEELALILYPVIQVNNTKAVHELYAIAQGLVGTHETTAV